MMTKRLEHIIEEINLLESDELEKVLKALLKRIHIESILDQYIGIGKGVWETDAQEYVNELRKEDTDLKREELQKFLLNGPVMSDDQYQDFLDNRVHFNACRDRKKLK